MAQGLEAKKIIAERHDLSESQLRAVVKITPEMIIVYGAKNIADYIIEKLGAEIPVNHFNFAQLPSTFAGIVESEDNFGGRAPGRVATGKLIITGNIETLSLLQ